MISIVLAYFGLFAQIFTILLNFQVPSTFSCLSEAQINRRYNFTPGFTETADEFIIRDGVARIVQRNVSEILMKNGKTEIQNVAIQNEIQNYFILKSVFPSENPMNRYVADMLAHGIYDNRDSIILPLLKSTIDHSFSENIPLKNVWQRAYYVITALEFLHAANIVHGNICKHSIGFIKIYSVNGTVYPEKYDEVYLFDLTKSLYINKQAVWGRKSRRDDMKHLGYTLLAIAGAPVKKVLGHRRPLNPDDVEQHMRNHGLTSAVAIRRFRKWFRLVNALYGPSINSEADVRRKLSHKAFINVILYQ